MSSSNMRDVAKQAGVSIATVSHVINNTRYVKEETRQKVLESIHQLNYHPNVLARSFKTGRRNLLAFIVPDIANPFYAAMVEAMEAVIAPHNYRLLISNTSENSRKESENITALSQGIVDGFLIASAFPSYAQLAPLLTADLPAVFVDRIPEGCPGDTFQIDNTKAIQEGIDYLVAQGHKRIAYVTVQNPISTVIERRAAYETAMASHGLPTKDLVFLADPLTTHYSDALPGILRKDITAVLVPNNTITTEILVLYETNGYKPGKDITIIGYKESSWSIYINPAIGLIHQPAEELGRAAGQQLVERLENPNLPPRRTLLTATFTPPQEK